MRYRIQNKIFDTLKEAEAIQFAIDWQNWSSEQNLSLAELAVWQSVLCELSEKYNLENEFQENGIL